MRIAGINSPNYHHNQPQKSQLRQSAGLPAESDQSGPARSSSHVTAAIGSQEIHKSSNPATHQKGALMQAPANSVTRLSGNSSEQVRYYAGNNELSQEVWNAYSSHGEASSAIPDSTSHKARAAIAEYLQTQFIEERAQFEQVLGVDEYA